MEGRYSRQEVLDIIGRDGQKKILESSVAVVGCGALGSVAAELLARAGIGKLILIDRDVVELSNLQRQALYTELDVSRPKAGCLKAHIAEINSAIKITAHDQNLNYENISSIISGATLVLDCTDNIDTRLLINEYCAREKLPWIHSAAIKQTGVVLNILPGGPCFRCVFPSIKDSGSCEELGILNSTSHITAATQVSEAIKILLGKASEKDMLRMDAWSHSIERLKVKKNPQCPVCRGEYAILAGKLPEFTIKECKTRKGWTVKTKKNVKLDLTNIKKKFKVVLDASILLVIDYEGEIIVHGYGELLFKDLKDEHRIRDIADEIFRSGGVK